MTKFSSRFAASTVSIFASAWMALPAFAQEAEPVAPQAANQGIGDIIVTAQKRAQSVNDVGLSITAASGEQLAASGVRDTGDLAKITPGFTFTKSQDGTPLYTLDRKSTSLNSSHQCAYR